MSGDEEHICSTKNRKFNEFFIHFNSNEGFFQSEVFFYPLT